MHSRTMYIHRHERIEFYGAMIVMHESEHRSKIESKHNFLFHKVASMIDQINKEAKQCKDNNERRRYMHFVYTVLYKGCIAKLSKFMNDNEYKEVQHIFHTFYGEVMDEIKQNIDSKQLGLASDMIGNQKATTRKKWMKMDTISLKWQMLVNEHNYDCEKDQNMYRFDMCCSDITKCQTLKTIHYIMALYKDHFLKRFVYSEDDGDESRDIHYIDVFQAGLDGYTATDLLNDYFHIEKYHTQNKELMDCVYGADDGDMICCALLWRECRESKNQRIGRGRRAKNNNYNTSFSEYLNTLDGIQKNILEISSKVHSFINHDGNKQEKQEMIHREDRTPKYNKFVNEID
eukprot:440151_1